jgi:hypothetical protein
MSDILIENKFIYNLELNFITLFSWISKIILFLYIVGFFQNKPSQFVETTFFFKVIIALFLIYRFNDYRKKQIHFTELDRKTVYSAGIYILLLSFVDIFDTYTQKIRSIIDPYTMPIIHKIKFYLQLV